MPTLLEATDLTKRYGGITVFERLSLALKASEAVALVGPSGAGKSTLLQLLGTLDTPDGGTLQFEGESLLGRSAAYLARFRGKHLGFIFQFHHLLADFTALENAALPARLAGASATEAQAQARALLTQLGLAERLAHKPAELSGGEQQRVAIARALVTRPKLILADEPTGNLDEANTQQLFDLLLQAARMHGAALLVATHNRRAAAGLDRVLELSGGVLTERVPGTLASA